MSRLSSSILSRQRHLPQRATGYSPARGTRQARFLLLFGFVLALAGTGFYLAGRTLGDAARARADRLDPKTQLRTSFGAITVQSVETMGGLTSEELGGMTHGIQSLVTQDKAQIEVALTLTNRLDHEVAYTPATFAIIAGPGGTPIEPDNSTLPAGQIRPNASIETTLSFVVPRDGSQFWIEFREPGEPASALVSLGQVDQVQQGEQNVHH
jgi:hypothetical protein